MLDWLFDAFRKPWPSRMPDREVLPPPNWRCSRRRLGGDYW